MVGPHHRIARQTKPVRQRMTPAKPQPAIHIHRTGAIQPRPLKRQNPVQRAIGEGEQFFPGDHRHRAAVGDRLVRWRRRISFRIRRHGRQIIDVFLTDQHGLSGLVANHRHRVRNQCVAGLQWNHWHGLDRRRRTAQQHRLGDLDMSFQPRPCHLLGQQFQQCPRTPRLDATKHLSTQAQLYPNASRGPDQQQIDQDFAGDFTQQFVHVRWRQHAYPGHQRRQVDKQQRLITEHQQTLGQRVFAQREQRLQLSFGQVFQQLLAIGFEIRE